MREVEIKALLVDPYQNTPVVLLKDQSSDKVVPIWIGTPEATAIAIALQQREFPRPLTHDLLQSVLETLGGELDMVVIDHIEDSTYFATLVVRDREGEVHEIDARPSDSRSSPSPPSTCPTRRTRARARTTTGSSASSSSSSSRRR